MNEPLKEVPGAGVPPLLQVEDLRVYLYTSTGTVKAIDAVSFELRRGETLGIVGESGSGKTMVCLSVLRLLPHVARVESGRVLFKGQNILSMSDEELHQIRGGHIALIPQDPHTALNPVFTVGNQVEETVRLHEKGAGSEMRQRVITALKRLKIPTPERVVGYFPHQLSGGMKQRVVGGIAMVSEPEIVLADEPTTALDVTIQAQYLALLRSLQQDYGTSIIFVTHDFGVVARMCDRVAVMYAGKIVETADTITLFDKPSHPYTRSLLESVPKAANKELRLPFIKGQPPDLRSLPAGCSFAPRCPIAEDRCHEAEPPVVTVGPNQWAKCWKAGE